VKNVYINFRVPKTGNNYGNILTEKKRNKGGKISKHGNNRAISLLISKQK
jgi:hypothetical protein